MRSVLILALALWPAVLSAEEIAGADAVFDGDLGRCTERPWDAAFADCLATLGAPEPAVALAERLLADPGIATAGVLTAFDERGTVDLGTVTFPAMANGNLQVLFLNGIPPLISPMSLTFAPPDDRAALALRATHPEAMAAGPPESAGYRDLPGGGQRFVLTDRITEGCRACDLLAVQVGYADFTDGRLSESRAAAWVAPEVALDGEAALAAMLAGDAAVLQYRLLVAGHDTGPADGVSGPRTLAELDAFLAENCLPSRIEEPEVREPALRVLAGIEGSACVGAAD